jgi:hypothetical protein
MSKPTIAPDRVKTKPTVKPSPFKRPNDNPVVQPKPKA